MSGELNSIPYIFLSQALEKLDKTQPFLGFICLSQNSFQSETPVLLWNICILKCQHIVGSQYISVKLEERASCARPRAINRRHRNKWKRSLCFSCSQSYAQVMSGHCLGTAPQACTGAVRSQRGGSQERETVELNLYRGLPDVQERPFKAAEVRWRSANYPL